MKTLLFLFVAILGLHPRALFGAQKDCDTPFHGRYLNFDHGYSFTVPAGYGGQWQSPCSYDETERQCICMGSHGLYIAITKNSGINVFSSYPTQLDEERPTQTQILASMVAEQRETAKGLGGSFMLLDSVLIKTNWARRISMRWVDSESKQVMKKLSYQLVTRVYRSQWPSAELTVSLIAPEAEFEARLPMLNEVLESFKWLRD
jgi:hypothetical protein